jgi:hypothetical protein
MRMGQGWMVALAVVTALTALTGCQGAAPAGDSKLDEAAKEAGLKPGQYAAQGTGANKVTNEAGMSTEVIKSYDVKDSGIEVFPGATLAAGGGAFVRREPKAETTIFEMETAEPLTKVADHYKKTLGDKNAVVSSEAAVISGKARDGRAVVISITRQRDGKTQIRHDLVKAR